MYYNENIFTFTGRDRDNEGVYFTDELLENLTECELLKRQADIEKRIDEKRTMEPSRKRKNYSEYSLWVKSNQDLCDELKEVRDELVKRKNAKYEEI